LTKAIEFMEILCMNPVKPPPPKRKESSLVSRLFGVVYILLTLFILYVLLNKPSPPQNLVCDRSFVGPHLTGFGACHME
jgi:hypothetical protein